MTHGSIAQLGEHLPYKQRVTGSSPGGPTKRQRQRMCASVAQLVEQRIENPRVVGSTPTGGTTGQMRKRETGYAGVAHPVERHLAKVEVASSSLVARSNFLFTQECIPKGYSSCYNFIFFFCLTSVNAVQRFFVFLTGFSVCQMFNVIDFVFVLSYNIKDISCEISFI